MNEMPSTFEVLMGAVAFSGLVVMCLCLLGGIVQFSYSLARIYWCGYQTWRYQQIYRRYVVGYAIRAAFQALRYRRNLREEGPFR